jgi:hypothetical protein
VECVVVVGVVAEDYADRPLDFNELLIEHPAAIFGIRIEGDSMTGAGIFPGDIAVVDRARAPVNGSIVLALVDGAFTVKRYRIRDGAVVLQLRDARARGRRPDRRAEVPAQPRRQQRRRDDGVPAPLPRPPPALAGEGYRSHSFGNWYCMRTGLHFPIACSDFTGNAGRQIGCLVSEE